MRRIVDSRLADLDEGPELAKLRQVWLFRDACYATGSFGFRTPGSTAASFARSGPSRVEPRRAIRFSNAACSRARQSRSSLAIAVTYWQEIAPICTIG
jgi:hypothetical protein